MDKEISKKIFIANKINTPKFITYSFNKENLNLIKKIDRKLKFPVVVKPINDVQVSMFIYVQKKTLKKF